MCSNLRGPIPNWVNIVDDITRSVGEIAGVEHAGQAGAEAARSVRAGVSEWGHQIARALTPNPPLQRNEIEGPDRIRQAWIGFLFRREEQWQRTVQACARCSRAAIRGATHFGGGVNGATGSFRRHLPWTDSAKPAISQALERRDGR